MPGTTGPFRRNSALKPLLSASVAMRRSLDIARIALRAQAIIDERSLTSLQPSL